jgi:ABC-type branched-subunit amino acid transport system substrate-binding protein
MHANDFSNIHYLADYINHIQEYPESDDGSYKNPTYTHFHRKNQSYIIDYIRSFFMSTPKKYMWNSSDLKPYLKNMIHDLSSVDKHKKIEADNSLYYLWSNIHGSIHSLVRSLFDLYRRSIIDDQLRIIKDNVYFVFNGNMINNGPHSLEVLTVIAHLYSHNPQQVMYIKGNHEKKQIWLDKALGYDIDVRAPDIKEDIKTLFDHLYSTLDIISYENDDIIRMCAQESPDFIIDRRIKSEIISDVQRPFYIENYGLFLQTKPSQLPSLWSIFSAPTRYQKSHNNIDYDSYIQMEMHKNIRKSTITPFYSIFPISQARFFSRQETYSLYCSHILQQQQYDLHSVYRKLLCKNTHYIDNSLYIGTSIDLSKGAQFVGRPAEEGLFVAFAVQNNQKGIHGKTLRLMVYDDEYTPSIAQANFSHMINNLGMKYFIFPVGTPTLLSALDMIKEHQNEIYVFFPQTGSVELSSPDLRNVINFRVSYEQEGYALTKYAVETQKARRIAFFYQNDSYGKSPLKGGHDFLKQYDQNIKYINIPYNANTTNFKSQVEAIKKFNPDTIAFWSVGPATTGLISQLRLRELIGKKLVILSAGADNRTEKILNQQGLDFAISRVVPNPRTSNLEIVQSYRDDMSDYGYKPNQFSLEAYIASRIMFDILKRIKGDITVNAINKIIETVYKDYTFHGLKMTFNPQARSLARYLWIDTGHNEWLRQRI